MKHRLPGLLLMVGCATSLTPPPTPEASVDEAATAPDSVETPPTRCVWEAMVNVLVVNKSTMDMGIRFGPYGPARPALGLSRTTYRVARDHLRYSIRVWIRHGGLETSRAAPVPTEHVVCNDATLIIGSRPQFSFFYGDMFLQGTDEDEKEGADTLSHHADR